MRGTATGASGESIWSHIESVPKRHLHSQETLQRPGCIEPKNMSSIVAPTYGQELGLGDHVAFFFNNNAERIEFVIPYIVNGLRNHERCVYIADENTVPAIVAEFQNCGVDVAEAMALGALSVVTKHDTYLRDGIFEPERMIADLDRDVRYALQKGFTGLRVTGEMSWALDLPTALSRLCDYEQELCRKWPAELGGLCQYNRTLFPDQVIQRVMGCHCVVAGDGKLIRHHAHRRMSVA